MAEVAAATTDHRAAAPAPHAGEGARAAPSQPCAAPTTAPHRFGVIALVGPPNIGKSTLINRLVGEKISIISRRPHTTRHRILGIVNTDHAQLVFADTPGLPPSDAAYRRAAHRAVGGALEEVDAVAFMIDGRGWDAQRERLLDRVVTPAAPTVLLINKIDLMANTEALLPLIQRSTEIHPFAEIIPLAARRLRDPAPLLAALAQLMPPGPPGFPREQRTDRSDPFRAAELVREQAYRQLGQELPYALTVEVTEFHRDAAALRVSALLHVRRSGHKAMVIGHGGQRLKTMGQNARRGMERAFGVPVHLRLWVRAGKGAPEE